MYTLICAVGTKAGIAAKQLNKRELEARKKSLAKVCMCRYVEICAIYNIYLHSYLCIHTCVNIH